MADISKINVDGVVYNIKDEVARASNSGASTVSTVWNVTAGEEEVWNEEMGASEYNRFCMINNKKIHTITKKEEYEEDGMTYTQDVLVGAYICLEGMGDGIGEVERLSGGFGPFECTMTSISKDFYNDNPENPITCYTEEFKLSFMTNTVPLTESDIVDFHDYGVTEDFLLRDNVKLDYSQPTILVLDNPFAPGVGYGPYGKWLTIPVDFYNYLERNVDPVNPEETFTLNVSGISI